MKTQLSLEQAKTLLEKSNREQLVDRAFGDAEVYWYVNGKTIADGYFGHQSEVSFSETVEYATTRFVGESADQLHYTGKLTLSQRNDAGA